MNNIIKIKTEDEIQACFILLAQLRPDIKAEDFVERILSQFKRGYQLAAVLHDDSIMAVAGYHYNDNLAWGKYLYIEDLITHQKNRSQGYGAMLLSWLHDEARKNYCNQLHLDSGIQRKEAHRFYEREGMMFASHHYVSKL
ncbi:MAG: GNAT family N-acetyltransferase [Gammaproteobacteria bacterium]|nr:GNAT family N-acetyltransferase [Gammaproteobacteria bacterium]MCW8987326.1 GNAT family N-acetyltransferase [Gammaproteobacteria bacterium]MCW9030318.1 GNAT family N-acetyltransferase [Gammaproteobacteria bacterium]